MVKGVKQGPSIIEENRDIYGFIVSSQHLQRYREYASIYEEEEAERSDRWELFLRTYSEDRQAELASGTITSEEQVYKNGSQKKDSHDNLRGSRDSTTNVDNLDGRLEYSNAGKQLKGNHRTVQTWCSVRPSLRLLERALRKQTNNTFSSNAHKLSVATAIDSLNSFAPHEQPLESGEVKINSESGLLENQIKIQNLAEEKSDTTIFLEESERLDSINFFGAGNQTKDKESATDEVHKIASVECSHKWEEIFHPAEALAARDELNLLVRGGVPMAFRGELWQVFVGTTARRVEGHYDVLLNQSSNFEHTASGAIEKWTSQIEKDLPRTFPGHPALDKDGRNALRRLLTAYARHNPDVGYCQAMNFFAALLLLLMPEENAFWTLTAIIDDYFEGYFSEQMLEAQVDQLVLEELMREYFPKLIARLEALGVQVAWITGPWFLSIFVNMLPWESVLRVWDVLLFEGNRCMLFHTALALMELHAPFIMAAHDVGDALSLLQSRTASTFDSSQLVFTACMGFQEADETTIEVLRSKHRPKVLATVDERAKEVNLWRSSQNTVGKKISQTIISKPAAKDNNGNDNQCGNLDGKEEMADSLSEHEEQNGTLHFDPISTSDGALSLQSTLEFKHSAFEQDAECDLQEQVSLLKKELFHALEEKKEAVSRAQELENALMELVKEDNRRLLCAKVEKLEAEVAALSLALLEKQKQEEAFLQTISRMEKEQAITKDAHRCAELDAAAQRYAANLLQEKYEGAVEALEKMEQRAIMAESEGVEALEKMEQRAILAESTLEATLQYQALDGTHATSHRGVFSSSTRADHVNKANGNLKPNSSQQHSQGNHDSGDFAKYQNLGGPNSSQDWSNEPATRKQGMFSRAFGLNWGERSKVH
ncbi:hypothetical protein O6H91_Y330200 [Diphasiastrum complanatum]|nr:hypothetical protein O6H91_Y330200 [Diphasiastrum complanatum]KAJ7285494.1 hypothetical protein O6H91_Y330200 [Diphasiastrum complanatum]